MSKDYEAFKSWLDLYGKAWQNRDPLLIKDLFSKNATYQEKPFESPMTGIESITKYWLMVAETQENVQFRYNILTVNENLGIAHWSASFLRKQTLVNLDGIFVVELNSENKCTKFREWWQSHKQPQ